MNPTQILPRTKILTRTSPITRITRITRRLGVRVAVASLAAAVVLIGCSSDDGDPTATATPTTTGATAAATATDTATATTTEQPAVEAIALEVSDHPDLGPLLVDPDGRTLYVFVRDQAGVSNCTDACLQSWPPLVATDADSVTVGAGVVGEVATIDRGDGDLQVTYNGAPLYYWAADASAGDATGHLVGEVWFVARPDTASTAVLNLQAEGDLAPYLVGPTGMTLYFFTNDEPDVSNCIDSCAQNWPPLTVPDGLEPTTVEGAAGELGVIERADGLGRQVTYDGMPLYYWAADAKPGDTTGHGVAGVWFVVPPAGDGTTASSGTSVVPDY
jgi:predicted lipoprotein with Yx(FWY)xxD motif